MNKSMNLNEEQKQLNQVSEKVIGCAYQVANTLGPGFIEKVYENALAHEIIGCGLKVSQQHRTLVHYDGIVVGDFLIDLVVGKALVLEIKAVKEINASHEAQLVNYLKAARLKLGLILNFGTTSVQVARRVNGF